MARPVHIPPPESVPAPVYFIAIPAPSHKALSELAAARNLSLAQLISQALSEFLKKTEGA